MDKFINHLEKRIINGENLRDSGQQALENNKDKER